MRQERNDAGNEECRKGEIQERRDAGKEGCRKWDGAGKVCSLLFFEAGKHVW